MVSFHHQLSRHYTLIVWCGFLRSTAGVDCCCAYCVYLHHHPLNYTSVKTAYQTLRVAFCRWFCTAAQLSGQNLSIILCGLRLSRLAIHTTRYSRMSRGHKYIDGSFHHHNKLSGHNTLIILCGHVFPQAVAISRDPHNHSVLPYVKRTNVHRWIIHHHHNSCRDTIH